MTDQGARSRDEELKLAYAARMMLITAVIFVAAGAVWLVSGTDVLIGVAFVAVGLVTAALARLLRSRTATGRSEP